MHPAMSIPQLLIVLAIVALIFGCGGSTPPFGSGRSA
jgi:Sec-independent protein translocase protein TatA